jgi:TetR/AcrR family tetracycline transcriptional repressor
MALHKQQIVAEALKLLDQEGIEGVTLRPLADRLGVQAPALYWHVKNKTQLLDEMAEAILQEQFAQITPRRADEPWQDWLLAVAQRLRAAMLAHREGARVVAGAHIYPALTLARLSEACLEAIHTAGIDLLQARTIAMTVIHFTFGHVIEEQASPSEEELREMNLEEMKDSYPLMATALQQVLAADQADVAVFNESLRLILHRYL